MKKLRLAVVASGALLAVAGFLIACSSDDTVVTYPDAGTDGGNDSNTPDSNPVDGGSDTGTDAPADTGAPDVIDAGLTLANYQQIFAETLCKTLARCCYGDGTLGKDAGIDGGGHYDQTACVSFFKVTGFEGSSGDFPATDTNLALDQTKGNDCVTKLTNLTCGTPGAEYTALAKACLGAVVGKQGILSPCTKSVECIPGAFCNNGNTATGACTAIRAADAGCSDFFTTDDPDNNAEKAQEACSYRGRGVDTGNYCDTIDFVGGVVKPQAEWKCLAQGGVGANCGTAAWCKDALCDDLDTAKCISPKPFFASTPPGSTAGCGKFATP